MSRSERPRSLDVTGPWRARWQATSGRALRELSAILRNLRDPPAAFWRVALLGGFSSGKTSLAATLLDEEVGTRNAQTSTRSVTRFRFGPAPSINANRQPLFATRPPALIGGRWREDRSALHDIPRIAEPGSDVSVELPAPVLADGVELWDTPGVDSQDERDRRIADDALVESDAVLYLMSRFRLCTPSDVATITKIAARRIPYAPVLTCYGARLEDPAELSRASAQVREMLVSCDRLGGARAILFAPEFRAPAERSRSDVAHIAAIRTWLARRGQ